MVGAYATFTFDDILGDDDTLRRAVELARSVAGTNVRVLIQGESGTGKELFAQAIHNASDLRDGPFIGINCSAIPSELMESELFGYNEGAFSGAKKGGMPGKFELADGGTIFLDEIDSMPQEMQIKLLRVLEENKITRVGGNTVMPVKVRILAASGKNLGDLVQQGLIRLDLYYRINTITLDIPPPARTRGRHPPAGPAHRGHDLPQAGPGEKGPVRGFRERADAPPVAGKRPGAGQHPGARHPRGQGLPGADQRVPGHHLLPDGEIDLLLQAHGAGPPGPGPNARPGSRA